LIKFFFLRINKGWTDGKDKGREHSRFLISAKLSGSATNGRFSGGISAGK
jgi:hypothetical protein